VLDEFIERGAMSWADTESSSEVDSKDVLAEEIILVRKSLTEGESAVVLAAES